MKAKKKIQRAPSKREDASKKRTTTKKLLIYGTLALCVAEQHRSLALPLDKARR
jgi:hypothetical protein